jgi:hypothetical protein
MSLDARRADDDDWEHSLCKEMVRRNFAIRTEEAFCSRQNNEERQSLAARAVPEKFQTYQEKEYAFHVIFSYIISIILNATLYRFEASRRFNAELMAAEQIHFPLERVTNTFELAGPNSPLEVKLSGKVKSLAGCDVTVDDDSVNSVLLDTSLVGKPEKILVAAQVSLRPCRFTA